MEFASCLLYTDHIDRFQSPKTVLACICLHKTGKGDGLDPQQLMDVQNGPGLLGSQVPNTWEFTERYEALVEKRGMFLQPSNMVEIHWFFFGLAVP